MPSSGLPPHWADDVAGRLVTIQGPQEISTGISPSGPVHIGNLREVVTADVVFRALREHRQDVALHYVADNFDPLRRVYPFLDASVYEPLQGKPISDIPCPCRKHENYADHFLQPFLETLKALGIKLTVYRGDELYRSGRMNPMILAALKGRDRIAGILQEMTGKQVADEWSPFDPLCPTCGRITGTWVRDFSEEKETVDYKCDCGASGTVPMAGGGKLTWRVDWPARWKLLGVTIEPFGKDHATSGGSYDTGKRIVKEIFQYDPPFPIPYEWISLKGRGDMAASKGNVLSIEQMLEVVPPEVLRYLIVRTPPARSIRFDPGLPLLTLVDEYDDIEAAGRDNRALALSRATDYKPVGVPFKHLVTVVQMANFDFDQILKILARGGYRVPDEGVLKGRVGYARRWLEQFAPADMRFSLQPMLPAEAARLTLEQRRFLQEAAKRLRPEQGADEIHQAVYELAGEVEDLKPAQAFQAIYLALLGTTRGPRVGWFLAFLDHDFVVQRFKEAGRIS